MALVLLAVVTLSSTSSLSRRPLSHGEKARILKSREQ
jgi:hypothetical protein